MIGGFFLLLLDGQVFRNSSVFLACVLVSASLWGRLLLRDKQSPHRKLAKSAIFVHCVLAIVVAATLPARYAQQKQINSAVENAIRRNARGSP